MTRVMRFGTREPIAFLCAVWELGRSCTMAEHAVRKFHIPVELVDVWTHRLDASAQPLLDKY